MVKPPKWRKRVGSRFSQPGDPDDQSVPSRAQRFPSGQYRSTSNKQNDFIDSRSSRPALLGTENLEVVRDAVNYKRYLLDLIRSHAGKAKRAIDFGAAVTSSLSDSPIGGRPRGRGAG
jgi:hypothetical protein